MTPFPHLIEMGLIVLIAASMAVQLAAAVLAFRLSRLRGWRTAWVMLAGAFVILALWGAAALVQVTAGADGPGAGAAAAGLGAALLAVVALRYAGRSMQADQATAGQREQYRILFEQASDGIILSDRTGRFVDANPAACALAGCRRDELLGRSPQDLIAPEDLAREPVRWKELRAGKTVRTRRRLVRPDGSMLPVEIGARQLADGQILALLRDASDRREYEEELERSLSLLQAALDSTADGILVVDAAGKIVRYNSRFAEMWRIPPDVLEAGEDERAAQHVSDQLTDPDAFLQKVRAIYGDPDAESFDVLPFVDGRVFERYSQPQRIGGESVGRVWSFRDVTERERAEEAVQERERRFRALAENSSDAIALLDGEGRVLYASAAVMRVKGFSPQEFADGHAFRFAHPDDIDRVTTAFRDCLTAPGKMVQVRYRSKHKDGSWRHMDAVGVNRLDDPAIEAVVVNFRDITEHKEGEEALRRSQLFLAQSQGIAHVGSWEWEVPTDRVTWSDELYQIYGLEPGSVDVTFDNYLQSIHPDDRALARGVVEVALQNKQPFEFDHRVILPDGSVRWLHGRGRVITDGAGDVVRMVGSSQDITERKQTEEALRRSEADYRTLVEHAPIGIFRADAGGRFLSVNPALVGILGYDSEAELLGVRLGREVYADPEDWAELIERHLETGYVAGMEAEWRRKDGVAIPVRLSGRLFRTDEGQAGTLEMIVEDVTERHGLEAQLRQAQKMEAVGQLTGGIAHDFNNLLTVILANADIVERGLLPEHQDLREDLADLRRAAQRGSELVRKLLGFSRRGMLTLEPTNISATVRELLPMLRRVLPENIEVRFVPREQRAVVRADPVALEQILLNLATNARDAMADGGTLAIHVTSVWMQAGDPALQGWGAPGEYARLAVADSGDGMDDVTKERIFDPFFTTKPPGLGTGLGMAMIYGLVKQQNGFIDVDSTPEVGTRVDLYFPLVRELEAEPAVAGLEEDLGGGSETILLVEDEPGIRRSAKRLLERKGYRVLLAGDGAEALDVYREHEAEVDLIISDVVMPRLGGSQLFETLRSHGKEVRFLFTSGYTARDVRDSGALDPNIPFLAKPWSVDELLYKVRELLDAR